MEFCIEKSGTGIGKSGTGIEKSGTGIGKSGTGIGKSGTGSRAGIVFALVLMLACITGVGNAMAANDARMLVSEHQGHLMLSIHTAEGIVAGHVWLGDDLGAYQQVPIFPVSAAIDGGARVQYHGSGSGSSAEYHGSGSGSSAEYHGSGSGSSAEYHGSGSGSSAEYHGSGSGSSAEYHGSGSGSAGEAFCDGFYAMYHGSGSGSSAEYHGSGSGSSAEYHGSGSGSSAEYHGSGSGSSAEYHGSGSGSAGEFADGCHDLDVWGFAEVVMDATGLYVIVHRYLDGQFTEFLVDFADLGQSVIDPNTGRAFLAP